jgi:hypothetical protein
MGGGWDSDFPLQTKKLALGSADTNACPVCIWSASEQARQKKGIKRTFA